MGIMRVNHRNGWPLTGFPYLRALTDLTTMFLTTPNRGEMLLNVPVPLSIQYWINLMRMYRYHSWIHLDISHHGLAESPGREYGLLPFLSQLRGSHYLE